MSKLVKASNDLLFKMYNEEKAIFSYSSHLNGENIINNFDHPLVYRYSIISLMGIQRANRVHNLCRDFDKLLENFLSLHLDKINNEGDKGLLLYMLSVLNHDLKESLFNDLEKIVFNLKKLRNLCLQDISWMLVGLTRYYDLKRDDQSRKLCDKLFKTLNKAFMNKDTLIPYHCLKTWRKPFVSFGAIVYFLWAISEYSKTLNDKYAETIFKESCMRVLELQGEMGEWPWFINANNVKIVDWYQIYSVHQDSMSMLFLIPALELGIKNAENAIVKSYKWLLGYNELGEKMILNRPFFIYRSIREKGKGELERRYLRSIFLSLVQKQAKRRNPRSLEINKECRSYHLGWILFIWSSFNYIKEMTEIEEF